MQEFSLPGFIMHLATAAVEVVAVESVALEKACVIVEKEAKESLGEYQVDAGPFAAWKPLTDYTMSERAAQGYAPDEPELRDGRMGETIEHRVVGAEGHIGSDDQILEWQELGTSKMPPRSILGGAAFRKEAEVVKVIGEEVVMALVGEEVFNKSLRIT